MTTRPREPRHGRSAVRHSMLAGILGFAAFVVVVRMAQMGLLMEVDTAIARAGDPVVSGWAAGLFPLVAAIWSPEASILLGAVGAIVLWSVGAGRWSLAPLGFMLLVPLEVAMKLSVFRPAYPHLLETWPSYLLVRFPAAESVVNGSPMRSGYLCALLAVVLWRQRGPAWRILSVASAVLGVLTGFVRVYGHYHWFSGELAGQLAGASLAAIVAVPLANRVREATRSSA